MPEPQTRTIPGYPDPVGVRRELVLRTYEYVFPFNYENVTVDRVWRGGERHGLELFPIKQTDPERGSSHLPADSITIVEARPIVRVAIVGSACTPPGWVTLEVEPVAGVRRADETIADLPLRFRADNLWGMHLRVDLLRTRDADDGRPRWGPPKSHYRELPLAGMSCAVFEIPAARSVKVKGGSQIPAWDEDGYPDDAHYSFRIIRTTVEAGDPGAVQGRARRTAWRGEPGRSTRRFA